MKKILALLLLISSFAYGQQNNTTNTKFPNGLASGNGATNPTSGVTAGMLFFKTATGMQYYDGSAWRTVGISGAGVTSFTGGFGLTPTSLQTGAVTSKVDSSQVQTVLNFFPKGDTRWAKTSTLAGYLPLTAGVTKPLTGILYGELGMNITGGSTFITSGTGGNVELSGDVGLQLTGGTYINIGSPNVYLNNLPSTSASGYSLLTRNTSSGEIEVVNATGLGTVTSVAALTLGTTGSDLSSSVANGTTTPVITLNVPTASASNRGALSSTDWSTFNNKIGIADTSVFARKTGNSAINVHSNVLRSQTATSSSTVGTNSVVVTALSGGFTTGVYSSLANSGLSVVNTDWQSNLGKKSIVFTDLSGPRTLTLIAPASIASSSKTQTFQDATGTVALTSDLPNAVTLAAIGSIPNANGATLSSGTFTLQPASASFGGVVTTGTQIFAGGKTFTENTLFTKSVPDNAFSTIIRNESSTGYATHRLYNDQNSATRSLQLDYTGSANVTTILTGGLSGEFGALHTTGAFPLQFGINNTFYGILSSTGKWGINTTTPLAQMAINGGLHVGGDSDPGDNNLSVDGTGTFGGKVTVGTDPGGIFYGFYNTLSATGGTVFTANGTLPTIQSGVTSVYYGYGSRPSTAAASFTLTDLNHYWANIGTIGASSAITNQRGFAVHGDMVGATNNYGFVSSLPAGATNWNLYMDGTAKNYIAGNLQLGSSTATAGAEKLQVTGTASISSTLSAGAPTFSGSGILSYSSNTVAANAFPRFIIRNTNVTQEDYNVAELSIEAGNGAIVASIFPSYSSSLGPAVYFRTNGSISANLVLQFPLATFTGTANIPLLALENGGAAPTNGEVTLAAGTATVNTTAATTGRAIFFQRRVAGGTIGFATTYTINSGTSFTVTSDSALDTSTYVWWIAGNY